MTEIQTDAAMELITQCQNGERQAFNRLVMQYQHLVYNFLYRMAPKWEDLDDLAQEVFVKVYHSIHTLQDASQFKTWLHSIAVNVYLDECRRRKKQQERFVVNDEMVHSQTDPGENPGERLERKELHARLLEAIEQLPEEFKLAIILRELQELSYQEIAKTLNISVGTIRSRIFRGRKLLQQTLKEQLAM